MPVRTLPLQTRLARVERATDTGTIEVVWSTGATVRRVDWWEGQEYLETVDLDGADLTRLNAGAPVLDSHQSYGLSHVIGVVERAWIEDGAGKAEIRFSDRPEVAGIRADVASGILRNLSMGYEVHETRIEKTKDGPDRVTVTRFSPMEISLVPVPADAGAQVRRDGTQPEYPVSIHEDHLMADDAKGPDTTEPEEKTTEITNEQPAVNQHAAEPVDISEQIRAAINGERARAAAIVKRCSEVGMPNLAAELNERGASLEQANAAIVDAYVARGGTEMRQAPATGKTAPDVSAAAKRIFDQVANGGR